MDVLAFVFGVGVVISGGIYLWLFSKSGEKWLKSL